MVAIVALGYEAGSWLKLAVSEDVDATVKAAQVQHPQAFVARAVLFAPDGELARRIVADVLSAADAAHQRLLGQCVAMPIGAVVSAIEAAAARRGLRLLTAAEWVALVERRAGAGW